MMSFTIYLVRHGETTWNHEGRLQGRLDSPLTPKGIEQARVVGRKLRQELLDVHTICIETSPLGRTRQTASIICEELGFDTDAVVVSSLLIEYDVGDWQGLTHAEIDALYPNARQERAANKWHYLVPGGESYALVAHRAEQRLASRQRPLSRLL